jgi:predicted GNAT family acetyltransferase
MHAQAATATARIAPPVVPDWNTAMKIHSLSVGEETEVLAFLAVRPLHTVIMAGLIRDNGLESDLNRGTFHACRNAAGDLEGVALIGHVTLFETQSDIALKLFAELARHCTNGNVIIGEQDRVQKFWNSYSSSGQSARLMCRELLLEQRSPLAAGEPVNLRRATMDDLELIVPVHAQMAFEESGINPLALDAEGFRRRVAHRIELGRVWVSIVGDKLIFKADVQAETPKQTYLEGVYTDPEERGKGYGHRCISQLGRILLESSESLCVLVNEKNSGAQSFYRKAGYELRGHYDTIFVGR